MNKVTMQDVADASGVSRVTVWKVFNYESVSEVVRANVMAKARELGYIKRSLEPEQGGQGKNVSLIVASLELASFWLNIIHSMARELYLNNINLLYTYIPPCYSDKFKIPPVLYNNTVQGAVVLNLYDEKLAGGINQLNIPKVFVDMVLQMDPRNLNGDLVLLEGCNTVYQITESVLSRGVRKAGFIGDIHSGRSSFERYEGFCQCMKDHDLPVTKGFCLTQKAGGSSYDREIHRFLDSLETLPEAFICSSDYIAHYLQFYFAEHQERIPEGIIVTGFDDGDDDVSAEGLITTASVKTDFFGKRIAMQIIYRMEHDDAPYEMTYVKPSVIYRDSVL